MVFGQAAIHDQNPKKRDKTCWPVNAFVVSRETKQSHNLYLATGSRLATQASSCMVACGFYSTLLSAGFGDFASRQVQPLRIIFRPDKIVCGGNRTR